MIATVFGTVLDPLVATLIVASVVALTAIIIVHDLSDHMIAKPPASGRNCGACQPMHTCTRLRNAPRSTPVRPAQDARTPRAVRPRTPAQ